jgi:hypothetical protein
LKVLSTCLRPLGYTHLAWNLRKFVSNGFRRVGKEFCELGKEFRIGKEFYFSKIFIDTQISVFKYFIFLKNAHWHSIFQKCSLTLKFTV